MQGVDARRGHDVDHGTVMHVRRLWVGGCIVGVGVSVGGYVGVTA